MCAFVGLPAAVARATPIVVLYPFVFAAPVFVFTPFLARSNGPSNIGHVKTGFARNGGYLKAFPEPISRLASQKFSQSTHQRFWRPSTGYECCERHRNGRSDPEQADRFPCPTS